jgi:DNA modification methylase
LAELKLDGFDMPMLAFTDLQLRDFMWNENAAGRAEEAPAAPDNPVSQRGDLWLLGNHHLVCGDCTNAAEVAAALGEARPHLMVTDPPYGVDYDPDWRNRADRANGRSIGARAIGRPANDERDDWIGAWRLFDGDVVYCWHAGLHGSAVQRSLEKVGFDLRAQIVWAKNGHVISRGHYHGQHESCFYAVRKAAGSHWIGDRSQTTLWRIDRPIKSETGHSTQKPIECMQRPIQNNSNVGDWVYDPFVGSGTTIIAADMIERRCAALEIEPAYVDVSVLRWENFTGKHAVLESTGRTYLEMKAIRHESGKTAPLRKNKRGHGLRSAGLDTAAESAGDAS